MLTLKTPAALEAASQTAACRTLKQLLADRLVDILSCELQHLTHVVVVEPSDSEAALEEVLGQAPTGWDYSEQHGQWCEYLYLGTDGFASIVFLEEPPTAHECRKEAQR